MYSRLGNTSFKKNVFFRALPEWGGGGGPCPNWKIQYIYLSLTAEKDVQVARKRGRGVIRAMPERKHSSFWEVFPNTYTHMTWCLIDLLYIILSVIWYGFESYILEMNKWGHYENPIIMTLNTNIEDSPIVSTIVRPHSKYHIECVAPRWHQLFITFAPR